MATIHPTTENELSTTIHQSVWIIRGVLFAGLAALPTGGPVPHRSVSFSWNQGVGMQAAFVDKENQQRLKDPCGTPTGSFFGHLSWNIFGGFLTNPIGKPLLGRGLLTSVWG